MTLAAWPVPERPPPGHVPGQPRAPAFPAARFGITRLADHTGLDDIGLPVWAAVRPGARSVALAHGKGLTHEQAQISALMEAAETALAETGDRLVRRHATGAELRAEGKRVLDLKACHKCRDPVRAAAVRRGWLVGRGLRSGDEVWVPLAAVSLDGTIGGPGDDPDFRIDSVGLAAHWSRDRAALHGLLEGIEYDAVALALAWPGILEASPAPDLPADPGGALDEAIDMVRAAGLEPVFHDITSDLGLACVLCWLDDRHDLPTRVRLRAPAGHACRFGLAEAALAALLEAAQSRLTDISGAREDIRADAYAQRLSGARGARPASQGRSLARPAAPGDTAAAIACVLDRLDAAGLAEPVVVDLAGPGDGLACVSVLLPGLEAGPAAEGYRTGRRARQRLIRHGLGLP